VARLATSGQARRTLGYRAPAGGIVLERKAVQGMRFMPGEPLFQIADLSTVWLVADVAEQDIGRIRLGTPARVLRELRDGELQRKREATAYYQALARRCLATLHEVQPLPAPEAGRRRLELPPVRPLTDTPR
jgi:multidrug resistance efflux pump